MRNRYILIFLTLVLLVVPSTSIIVTAGSGHHYPMPNGIKKGDIVLIEWNKKPNPLHRHLAWDHAMLYAGNGMVYNAWNGVEYLTWDNAIEYNYDYKHGGIKNLAVIRVQGVTEGIIQNTLTFASYQAAVHADYDDWSQDIYHLRALKQVKRYPDSWWWNKLPPIGYYGPHTTAEWWVNRFSDRVRYNHADEYYCTELCWAAYFQGSLGKKYLEATPDEYAITGEEIQKCPLTYTVSGPTLSPEAYDEC